MLSFPGRSPLEAETLGYGRLSSRFHANILGGLLKISGPLMNEVSDSDELEKMMVLLESAICYVHGIAPNVITISEYPWNNYEKYIDVFLDATL